MFRGFEGVFVIASSFELKEVSFSDRLLSVICVSVTFHIFHFFSKTIEPISVRPGILNYPLRNGIIVCTNECFKHPSTRGDNSKKSLKKLFLIILLQNQQANFNQTLYTSFLGEGISNLFK
jgi:hypothetical protein